MKKITTLLPLMAVAMMVSCSKDTDLSTTTTPQESKDGAYVTLSIAAPKTRANHPDQEGTEAESAVTSVKLIAFDKAYNYLSTSDNTVATRVNEYEFTVSPDAYRFFVVVNPTPAINTALGSLSGNWNNVSQALQKVISLTYLSDLDVYKADGAFPMVNAGSYVGGIESVLVRPTDADLEANGKLSIDPLDPTPVTIKVDRMVAKFNAKVASPLEVADERTEAGDTGANPFATIDGVRLNVINKKSYIYSHINQANSVGDDYRADPNMAVTGETAKPQGVPTSLTENFFWLHNYENPVFNLPGDKSTEYVFENTADGTKFDYNNLTQLVVKATYIPTGQVDPPGLPTGMTTRLDIDQIKADGNTWFAIDIVGYGTMQMTFGGLVKYYENALTSDADRTKMDIQLRHMLAEATTFTGDLATVKWNSPEVTCAVLNSIPNGGYVAATVPDEENYIVQFYQFGLNYYDIFVQHDEAQAVGHLGRWGMVRNNHYTLTINSISGPGLPYIPDPTDEKIKDPKNPDPLDPEPADKGMAFINATIEVNWWTMWTQKVDL